MALKTRQPKFADDEIVVCWNPFATHEFTIPHRTRLRGDHPAVQAMPDCFVLESKPEAEWPSVWDFVPDPAIDEPATRTREPIPDSEAAVCVIAFTTATHSVGKGARLRRDDPIVQANKAFFRTPMMPLEEP